MRLPRRTHPYIALRLRLAHHALLQFAASLNGELGAFAMTSSLQQSITALSLGQHKKLQLALALALPVRLLLIDEPFNGLDAAAMAHLRTRLAEPARLARQCIVLTSHLAPEVPLAATVEI